MRFILLFFILLSFSFGIEDYKIKFYCITPNKLVIREFKDSNKTKFLIVNTKTLQTKIINYIPIISKCNQNNLYFKLLNQKPQLQNAGIIKTKNKIVLTTDLCPSSKKGFDKRIFTSIIQKYKNPVPVTIFITLKWIKYHKKSFLMLKKWQQEHKLNIIWGNHTATHPYKRGVPLNKNFVLIENYNLQKDVITLEKYLIENQITPSIFFRFPGLVSDKKTLNIIKQLGLIVIGSNSWLAKGEKIKSNSIILIHANKNEEKGVDLFLKNLDKIDKLNPVYNSL